MRTIKAKISQFVERKIRENGYVREEDFDLHKIGYPLEVGSQFLIFSYPCKVYINNEGPETLYFISREGDNHE